MKNILGIDNLRRLHSQLFFALHKKAIAFSNFLEARKMGDAVDAETRRRGDAEMGRQGRDSQFSILNSQFPILNSQFSILK